MKRLQEGMNIEVDADFFKNKIVCIWDDVVTTGSSFCAYSNQLEQVGAHVTDGIFLGKTSYNMYSNEKETTTHLTGLNQQPSQDIVTMTSHEKRLSGNVCHEPLSKHTIMASETSFRDLPQA